jgi:hypothetical protein
LTREIKWRIATMPLAMVTVIVLIPLFFILGVILTIFDWIEAHFEKGKWLKEGDAAMKWWVDGIGDIVTKPWMKDKEKSKGSVAT